MNTGYFTHPACRRHEMGRGHPECPERLDSIEDHLISLGLDVAVERFESPSVAEEALGRAHDVLYVRDILERMQRASEQGQRDAVDPDTTIGAHTWQAALHSAGAAVAATDAVIGGRLANAFCAVRPPGHHATRSQAMGFCFFNNVAVAARHALDVHGLKRVAVVDFDVHHGNGTEDILAGDERVLMVSFFQHPLYPNSGTQARGENMVNLPVPPYTKGMEIRELVDALWIPRLEQFRPEMLFVSAGFDAHRDDDLGQLGLVEADYEWITRRLMDVADRFARGRIVSCLEGGYNLGALGRSVAAHLRALAKV